VEAMRHVLDDHIQETEAPGSFYDDVWSTRRTS
jgi:hypothetical protein